MHTERVTAPLTKGVGFHNVRSFVVMRFGEQAYENVLHTMDVEDQSALDAIVPVGWYELALYARLIHALNRQHGRPDLSLLDELGRYEAQQDLTTIHRLFMKVANPGLILAKSMELWRRFHDTGEWEIVRHSSTAATGTLRNWGIVDAGMCTELCGYIEGIISVGSGRDVRVKHLACRVNRAPACVFEGSWR
jgi:hypothetical protein